MYHHKIYKLIYISGSWLFYGFTKFHFMEVVSSCFWTSTAAPSVIKGMSAHITFRERSLVTQIELLSACRDEDDIVTALCFAS